MDLAHTAPFFKTRETLSQPLCAGLDELWPLWLTVTGSFVLVTGPPVLLHPPLSCVPSSGITYLWR